MKVTMNLETLEITMELDAHDPAEVEAARRLLWNVENPVKSVETAWFGNPTPQGVEVASRVMAEIDSIMKGRPCGVSADG